MSATIQPLATTYPLPYEQLPAFCQRWKITELALFGSILRDDFGPNSDIDRTQGNHQRVTLDVGRP
ncbi:MAG: nucleotidyltransferase family protein [Leptolyngbyaceae cyanobacterium]